MKFQFSKYLIYTFLAVAILLSCKAESSEKPFDLVAGHLYANYYLRYIENANTIKVVAKFSTIEDSLTLNRIQLPKLPTFQGLTMTYNPRMKQYEFESFKKFEEEISIKFTNNEGEIIEHKLNFSVLKEITIKNNPIYKSSGFTINWTGENLVTNEDLFITIQHSGNKPLQMNWIGVTKKSELFIRKEQLPSLEAGKGNISFVKKKLVKIQPKNNVMGIASIEYYTKEIPIIISE